MSSSASEQSSDQSEGGVPLYSPRTPAFPSNRGSSTSFGENNEGQLTFQTSNPYGNSGAQPRQFVFRHPHGSYSGDFQGSTISTPDYHTKRNTAPLEGYNPSLLSPIPAGAVPRASQPSPSHGYYSIDNSNNALEELSTTIGTLTVGSHPDQQSAHFHIRLSHQRVHGIIQAARQHSGLPQEFADQLDFDLKETSKGIVRVNLAVDSLARALELKTIECDRIQATAGLQAVEIERLKHEIETARRETQSAEKNNEEIQTTYQGVLRSMEDQARLDQDKIKVYEEQLNDRRQLFLAASRDARERANTPALFQENTGPNSSRGRVNPPAPDRTWASASRPLSVPTAGALVAVPARPASAFHDTGSRYAPKPRSTSALRTSSYGDANNPQYRVDEPRRYMSNALGSPVPSRERQEFMNNPSTEVDPVVLHWREMFNKVFSTVRGWCGTYATEVKVDDGAQVQARAPKLWGFIADILYPGQFESGSSHAKHLLQEAASRPYLVERIMLQYIVNTMFSVDGWSDFREDVDHQLNILSERLHTTELFKTFERQVITDQIAAVINTIILDPEFPAFRQRKQNYHHQRLKTIVGPLMDNGASRSDAGFDLHNITATALQTSANIFQSRLNLQFTWSNTCSKFSVEAHTAKDAPVDPVTLQMRQYRLKLVITPSITLRDDRGLSVMPKRVQRAEVLVMK